MAKLHHNYTRLSENILQYNSLQRVSAHWKYSFLFLSVWGVKQSLTSKLLFPKYFCLNTAKNYFFLGSNINSWKAVSLLFWLCSQASLIFLSWLVLHFADGSFHQTSADVHRRSWEKRTLDLLPMILLPPVWCGIDHMWAQQLLFLLKTMLWFISHFLDNLSWTVAANLQVLDRKANLSESRSNLVESGKSRKDIYAIKWFI